MSDESIRQHARLASGRGLQGAPPSKPNPGFKRGGKVMKKMTASKRASKRGC